jgi:hypothetical protein
MPILAFAAVPQHLSQTLDCVGHRTLIEVSEVARDRIETAMAGSGRCCSPDSVKVLRELMERREFDAELALLIAAIVRDGQVYVRFL